MTSLRDGEFTDLAAKSETARSMVLPASPSVAPLARSFIREHTVLDSMRHTEADLLITEMICNVVRHAGCVDEVELRVDTASPRSVSISLTHDFPRPLGEQTPGAGFVLLSRLSQSWGHDHDGSRLRVWFTLRKPGSISRQDYLSDGCPSGIGPIDTKASADVLVRQHRDLATAIARRYRGKGISDEDLEQVALMGLLKAIHRYDSSRGDLRPYAAATISGELKRWLRDKGWSVRVPRAIQERVLATGRASEELTQRLGREPTADEVAVHLGLSEDDILEAGSARKAYSSRSADAPIPGVEISIVDGIEDESCVFKDAEDRVILEEAISRLPHRQRLIMSLRFNEDMNQSEIAEVLGVSQVHVSRLLSDALEAMRETLVASD